MPQSRMQCIEAQENTPVWDDAQGAAAIYERSIQSACHSHVCNALKLKKTPLCGMMPSEGLLYMSAQFNRHATVTYVMH